MRETTLNTEIQWYTVHCVYCEMKYSCILKCNSSIFLTEKNDKRNTIQEIIIRSITIIMVSHPNILFSSSSLPYHLRCFYFHNLSTTSPTIISTATATSITITLKQSILKTTLMFFSKKHFMNCSVLSFLVWFLQFQLLHCLWVDWKC